MAPAKRAGKQKASSSGNNGQPPAPFKLPPDVLSDFTDDLSRKHVYVAHIDNKPASFKRKIFLVPVAMNVCVAVIFVWRMYSILPWYAKLFSGMLGNSNDTKFVAEQSTWAELGWEILKRGLTMFIDFLLFVFVWPWPVEFVAGQTYGSPVRWRWTVGFRDQEIYVRRSRDWNKNLGNFLKDAESKKIFTAYVGQATSPILQEQKTGYLLMNASWDLDWEAMIKAHEMVDKKEAAMNAFKNVVLAYHEDYGWLCYDIKQSESADEQDKRRQVFAFRDALTAMGKEDLFYRWVETVQFEATQPGGFGPEKQEEAAKKIRDLFESHDVNFDELWRETVGTDGGPVL